MEDRIVEYLEIAGLVVALASAIAAATPGKSDNRAVDALIRVLDAFALNWGKRNPRASREAPERPSLRGERGPLLALMLLPLIGACAQVPGEREPWRQYEGLFGRVDRVWLERTLTAYNDAGLDPFRLDEDRLRYWDLACVTALLVDPDPLVVGDCELVREALAAAGGGR